MNAQEFEALLEDVRQDANRNTHNADDAFEAGWNSACNAILPALEYAAARIKELERQLTVVL